MTQKPRPNSGTRKGRSPDRPDGTASGSSQRPVQTSGGGGSGRSGPLTPAVRPATEAGAVSPLHRQEQRQRGRAPQRPPNRGKWAAAGIILIPAVLIMAVLITRSVQTKPTVLKNEVQQTPSAAGIHVAEGTSIQYAYNPPSSGPHYPSPASWGVYPQPLAPGTWVHNLEHGGIVVLYQCPTSCTALQAQMQALHSQIPFDGQFQEKKVIITPFANLDHLLRVQAWGWTMPLDTVDTAAIDAFYREHVNKGPEVIP